MTVSSYITFMSISAALIFAPGPDFVFALSRGLAHGWRGGVLAAAGIGLGLCTHTAAALLGLAALIQVSPLAYGIIKYAGIAFLVYLSIRMLIGRDLQMPASAETARSDIPKAKILRQAYVTNVLNPGPLITFSALLPQFIPAGSEHYTRDFLILALSQIASAVLWFSLTGSFAGVFTGQLRAHQWLQRVMRIGFGVLLLALAIMVALRHVNPAPAA